MKMTRDKSFTRRVGGFTLIEMMIAMVIIGVLLSVVAINVLNSQKRGYDARRQGDMKALQNAMEQAYAENNDYPIDGDEAAAEFQTGSLPVDPRDSGDYIYQFSFSASYYCGCALLEVATGNAADASCNFGTGNYFCVENVQ